MQLMHKRPYIVKGLQEVMDVACLIFLTDREISHILGIKERRVESTVVLLKGMFRVNTRIRIAEAALRRGWKIRWDLIDMY